MTHQTVISDDGYQIKRPSIISPARAEVSTKDQFPIKRGFALVPQNKHQSCHIQEFLNIYPIIGWIALDSHLVE